MGSRLRAFWCGPNEGNLWTERRNFGCAGYGIAQLSGDPGLVLLADIAGFLSNYLT